jgi:hypothetical protein
LVAVCFRTEHPRADAFPCGFPLFRKGPQPSRHIATLATLATAATVGVVGLIGAGPCIPIEMSQPVLRNQFHPPTAGRSKTGKPEPGTPTLPAGVSRLGWIEDAIGWPSLVAPRADVVVGAMARPALRPVRKWREADAPPSPVDRPGSQCRCRDCWSTRSGDQTPPQAPLRGWKRAPRRGAGTLPDNRHKMNVLGHPTVAV